MFGDKHRWSTILAVLLTTVFVPVGLLLKGFSIPEAIAVGVPLGIFCAFIASLYWWLQSR